MKSSIRYYFVGWCCVVLIASCVLQIMPAYGQGTDDLALDMVLSGWRHNYDALKAVSGVITYRRFDSVQAKTHLSKLYEPVQGDNGSPQGLSALPVENQYRETSLRFVIRGEDLRFDGSFFDPESIAVIRSDKLLLYSASSKHLQVNSRNYSSLGWRDPRQVFFEEFKRYENELLGGQVLSVSRDTKAVTLKFANSDGSNFTILCDVTRDYLPIVCWELGRPDGRQFSTEINYKPHAIEDSVQWFPDGIEFKSWGIASARHLKVQMPLTTGWWQRFLYRVTELSYDVEVDEAIFHIEPSDGTFVADTIANTGEYVGDPPRQTKDLITQSGGTRRGLLFGTFAAVILLAVLVFRKRRIQVH